MSYITNRTQVLSVEATAQMVEVPRIVDLSSNLNPIMYNSHVQVQNTHATQLAYVRVNHDGGPVEEATTAVGGYDYVVPNLSSIIVSLSGTMQLSLIASGAATPVYLHWGKDT